MGTIADSTLGFSDSTLFGNYNDFRILAGSEADERDPKFLPDEEAVLFMFPTEPEFSIYIVCLLIPEGRFASAICYGGAFAPSIGDGASLYYAGYTSENFSIYRTDAGRAIEETEPVILNRDYSNQPKAFDLGKTI